MESLIPESRSDIGSADNFVTLVARGFITVAMAGGWIYFKSGVDPMTPDNLKLLGIVGGGSFLSGSISKTLLPAMQNQVNPSLRTTEAMLVEPVLTGVISGFAGKQFLNTGVMPVATLAGGADFMSGFVTPTVVSSVEAFMN